MNDIPLDLQRQIAEEYKSGATYRFLEDKYEISRRPMRKIINRFAEARHSNSIFTTDQRNEIIQMYKDGRMLWEIGERFGCLPSTIKTNLLKYMDKVEFSFYEHKWDRRGSSRLVRDNLMKNLSNEDSAWLLGFITTDGCLCSSVHGRVSLSYSVLDKELTEKFKSILNGGSEYLYIKKSVYHFQFHSKEIYNDLLNLNLTPKKSLTLQFPPTQNLNMPAYLLGVLDGDGTISIKNNKLACNICSASRGFIESVSKVLFEWGIENRINSTYKSGNSPVYQLWPTSKKAMVRFLNILYKHSSPQCRLERKYNNYLKFLEDNPNYKSEEFLNSNERNFKHPRFLSKSSSRS